MALCHAVASHIGLLENIDPVRDTVLLNIDLLHFVRPKVTIDLGRIVFHHWKVVEVIVYIRMLPILQI